MSTLYIPEGEGQAALRFRLTGDDEEMVVTLGIRDPATPPMTDPAFWALQVYNAAIDAGSVVGLPATYSSYWTFVGVTVTIATATGGLVGSHEDPEPGTVADETVPQNSALLVHKNTAVGGRHGKGRNYWPLFNIEEGDVTPNGMIAAAALPGYQTRLNNFYAELLTLGVQPVLHHYPIQTVPNQVPPVYVDETPPSDDIVSFTVDPKIGTQRRRLRH